MKYYVISPSGEVKLIEAKTLDEIDRKAADYFGKDYWINNQKYSIMTSEQYADILRSQQTQTENQRANQPVAQESSDADRKSISDRIAEFAFPVSMELARRGADPKQFLPVAAGEAALMALPSGIASKAAQSLGLKGVQQAITRGLLEGTITALGDYGLSAAGERDKSLSESAVSGATALLPDVVGAGVSRMKQKATELAPRVLEYSLVPSKSIRESMNPPDYRAMLEEGLVSPLGLEKTKKNIEGKLEPIYDARKGIIDALERNTVEKSGVVVSGRKFDLNKIESDALNLLRESNLSPYELKQAKDRVRKEFDLIRDEHGRYVRPRDIESIKDKIQAKYEIGREEVGERGKEAVKTAIQNELKESVPGYAEYTEQMARYIPMQEVVEGALSRRRPIVWLRDMPSMGLIGAGGMLSAMTNNPGVAIAGLLGGLGTSGATRLFSTPGGAALLYRYGQMPSTGILQSAMKPLSVSLGRQNNTED